MGALFPVVDFQTEINILLYDLPMIFLPNSAQIGPIRAGLRRCEAQLLFSLKHAVCCCVYLNSRE